MFHFYRHLLFLNGRKEIVSFPLSLNSMLFGSSTAVLDQGFFAINFITQNLATLSHTNPAFFAAYILYGSVWRGFVSYGQLVCTEPLANPWPWSRQCHTRFLRSLIATRWLHQQGMGRGVILYTLSHLSIKVMRIPCKKKKVWYNQR
jgi:hypothetical protein